MADNKFNINNLLGGIPTKTGEGPATEREAPTRPMLKVIPININDLIPSSDNFYSVENIAELKTSIEMFGVVQPLAVKPLEGGKFRIIAGHRRRAACMELVREGKTEFEYIPCGIQAERDEIKERILFIMTNSTTRELSDWEKMKQAEELQKYFTVLKKRDNLPGRVRDLVAEALNTSPTQIARMTAITNNLASELKDEFQEGRLGLSAAYELSGLPEDKQKEAFEDLQEKGGLSLDDIKEKKEPQKHIETSAKNSRKRAKDDYAKRECKHGGTCTNAENIVSFMQKGCIVGCATCCSYCIKKTSCAKVCNVHKPMPTSEQMAATDAKKHTIPQKGQQPTEPPEPRPAPKHHPETPPDFEEGQEDEQDAPENQDFADMSVEEKAEAAIAFLNCKRFTLFTPGEDTRVLDFIIESLENYGECCVTCDDCGGVKQ